MADAQPEEEQSTADQRKRSTVPRRSLFGTGRSEDTDEWLQDMEKKTMEEKVQKWNFDFREGKPLEDTPDPGRPSSSHVYEAIDAKEVPAFYRTKTVSVSTESMDTKCRLIAASPRKRRLVVKSHSSGAASGQHAMVKKEEGGRTSPIEQAISPRKRLRKAPPVDENTPQKKTKVEGEEEREVYKGIR